MYSGLLLISRDLIFHPYLKTLLKQILKLLNGPFRDSDGVVQGERQLPSRSVQMSAAVKESFSHFVARKIIDRAKRHADNVPLSIFPQRDAQFHASHLQRHVDQSFSITSDVMVLLHFLACDGKDRGLLVFVEFQLGV